MAQVAHQLSESGSGDLVRQLVERISGFTHGIVLVLSRAPAIARQND
jgi:hypothetical protein